MLHALTNLGISSFLAMLVCLVTSYKRYGYESLSLPRTITPARPRSTPCSNRSRMPYGASWPPQHESLTSWRQWCLRRTSPQRLTYSAL